MTFRFVHQQLKGIVPPLGVVDAKLSFKTNNQKSGVFNSWFYHIDGYYEMARGQFSRIALAHFTQVVAKKIQSLNNDRNLFKGLGAMINNGAGAFPAVPANNDAGGTGRIDNDPKRFTDYFGGSVRGVLYPEGDGGAVTKAIGGTAVGS